MITIKNKFIKATIDSDFNIMSESKNLVVLLRDAIQEAKRRAEQPPYHEEEVALFYYLEAMDGFEVEPDDELKELLQPTEDEDESVVY